MSKSEKNLKKSSDQWFYIEEGDFVNCVMNLLRR